MDPDIIYIDIVERNGHDWRIIGLCPTTVTPSGGLHVYRGEAIVIRDCATDNVIVTGRSLRHALSTLADRTGLTVHLTDETIWHTTVLTPTEKGSQP